MLIMRNRHFLIINLKLVGRSNKIEAKVRMRGGDSDDAEFQSINDEIATSSPSIPDSLKVGDFISHQHKNKPSKPDVYSHIPINEDGEGEAICLTGVEKRIARIEESIEQMNQLCKIAVLTSGIMLFGYFVLRLVHR
ncbi:hypothetical protein RF11_00319 [Thelohanellus kitauei]|uniref:Uncharacterized protein n=1 Tax=Thelohanellus kitauei TaxID=669202 RepID=A0A0C2MVF2_THEKT|nr:hypothetical protein RF11_00319 [Thelohanellus kitauei]